MSGEARSVGRRRVLWAVIFTMIAAASIGVLSTGGGNAAGHGLYTPVEHAKAADVAEVVELQALNPNYFCCGLKNSLSCPLKNGQGLNIFTGYHLKKCMGTGLCSEDICLGSLDCCPDGAGCSSEITHCPDGQVVACKGTDCPFFLQCEPTHGTVGITVCHQPELHQSQCDANPHLMGLFCIQQTPTTCPQICCSKGTRLESMPYNVNVANAQSGTSSA